MAKHSKIKINGLAVAIALIVILKIGQKQMVNLGISNIKRINANTIIQKNATTPIIENNSTKARIRIGDSKGTA